MANAVIYARFSCSRQREESIEDQIRVCREAADKAGDKIIKVYSDSALSGKTDDRPQFQRMIADSERGIFELVYVYKTDRFARNRYDSATNKAKLRKNGVKVVAAAEHIPDGADGVLLESLLEGMAEYYSAQLSQNVRRGIEGNAQKCMANGQPIYGYDIDSNGKYVINKQEAKVVKTMFNVYADGGSFRDIVTAIEPARPRSGKQWTYSTIGNMLRREQYNGVYKYAGVRIEGGMPAIVNKEVFMSVQNRLSNKKHAARKDYEVYELSGKLYDEDGNTYVGSGGTGRRGNRYHYYYCKETGHRISRDELNERIARCCAIELEKPGMLDLITKLILQAQENDKSSEQKRLELLEQQLQSTERKYDNAIDAVAELGLNDSLRKKIKDLEEEREDLKAEIADAKLKTPTITPEMVEFWVNQLIDQAKTDDLLRTFVTRVIITKDSKILVAFLLDDLCSSVAHGLPEMLQNDEQKQKEHPVETGCSYMLRMVGHTKVCKNIVPLANGFVLIIKAA